MRAEAALACVHPTQICRFAGICSTACRAEQRRHGGHTDIRQELVLQIKAAAPQQPDLKLTLTEVSAVPGLATRHHWHHSMSTIADGLTFWECTGHRCSADADRSGLGSGSGDIGAPSGAASHALPCR